MTDSANTPYAGDLSPKETWEQLAAQPSAHLVDVRTQAEWDFVGIPDLRTLERQPHLISWQVYPQMAVDPAFIDRVKAAGAKAGEPIFLLCRSGVRKCFCSAHNAV